MLEQWEMCTITYETVREVKGIFPKETVRFVAKAAGPRGEYIAAKSKAFALGAFNVYGPNEKKKEHAAALAAVVKELIDDGWEQVPEKGRPWFNLKFRRQVEG